MYIEIPEEALSILDTLPPPARGREDYLGYPAIAAVAYVPARDAPPPSPPPPPPKTNHKIGVPKGKLP